MRLAEAGNVKKRAEILLKYLSENQKDQAKDSVHVLEEYLRQRIMLPMEIFPYRC